MDLRERGVSEESGPVTGWLGRFLAAHRTGKTSPLRAIALGETVPRSLTGSKPVMVLQDAADARLGRDRLAADTLRRSLAFLYSSDDHLGRVGRKTLAMLDTLDHLEPARHMPATGAHYPATPFGDRLRQIAMLIKADVGVEVAATDLGGRDTHFAQGALSGHMPSQMAELASGLAAWHADLGDHLDRLTLVVMSEFGRRAYENAGLGTDHGHGGMMLLMGKNVVGGRVHGMWPGLGKRRLVGPGDLAVTTDYRDVLSEILTKRRNSHETETVFPKHSPVARGIVR